MADAAQEASTPAPRHSQRSSSDLVEGFTSLNWIRQAALMVGLAVSVAIGFAVVLWTQEPDYRPLYGSLERMDAAEVAQVLDTNQIDYKMDPNTGALLVPADAINQARLKLAEQGIPGEQTVGFELLDQEQPLGSSQFMENARYRRSLEGELARTITSIRSVRTARVHLAIPKPSVFIRDAREPRASVFVELYPGRTLSPAQVKAVANLVASSITELNIENVSIVDQKGELFVPEMDDPEFSMAAKQREYTKELEQDYGQRIASILRPVVGADNYQAEVSAEVDFTQVEQAAETYNPDLAAVRSEQIMEESRTSGDNAAGVPGALTNQPPGTAQAPEQATDAEGNPIGPSTPQTARNQTTRNYELDRTLSYTKHQIGKLQRLSVAVALNDKLVTDPASGETSREPWSDAEMQRIGALVRDAVGFSAARGDSVNIVNTPFVGEEQSEPIPIEETPFWQKSWFQSILKQVGAVFIILALLFGLLRPVLKNLAQAGQRSRDLEEERELAALESSGIGRDGLGDETVTLSGGGTLGLPTPDQGYEQQLNVVKGLIAEDPGRVAQVIKRWAAVEE